MAKRDTSQQNATLSAAQETVLAALVSGESVTAAAQAAGVDRTTVHRWLSDDCEFKAELNRLKLDLRREYQTRLLKLADTAVKTVEDAVKGGDVKAALVILKDLGLLSKSATVVGSTDPVDLSLSYERL